MKPIRLFQPGSNPWINGLRLALINVTLAAFSIASFMGVLYVVSSINRIRLAGNSTSSELPFPYPVLMVLYAVMFLIAWTWLGHRLPHMRREKLITTLVGSAPLFVLGFLGYAGVIGGLVFDAMKPDIIPVASFYVFGGISTLILFAGITCVGLVLLVRGNESMTSTGLS